MFYKNKRLNLFKQAFSVNGITKTYLFSRTPKNTFFSLIGKKDADLHQLMRNHLVGGPSTVLSLKDCQSKMKL